MSGQELERRESDLLEAALARVETDPTLVLPSGEVVDLREAEQVAHGLEALDDTLRTFRELRTLLEALLRLESQRQGTKTLRFGEHEVKISGGDRIEWDHDLLAAGLLAAGCPQDRIEDLVRMKIEYSVDGRVARQLQAANPEYAAAIAAARTRVPARWRVSVKRR